MTEEPNPQRILVKYGGNAMTDEDTRARVLDDVVNLHTAGHRVVLVHGGGPAIAEILEEVSIESEFVGGHRRTDHRAMRYVQMALRGRVNADLVRILVGKGVSAVGLSGKDAGMVVATRRVHRDPLDPSAVAVDLGQVGDVARVQTTLLDLLLDNDHLPVVAPIALGEDGQDYNVNADVFAGHVAAALRTDVFIALTDVDGLRRDPADAGSVVRRANRAEIEGMIGTSIQGGMIPKIDACLHALDGGVPRAHIIDGTQEGSLHAAVARDPQRGTEITP